MAQFRQSTMKSLRLLNQFESLLSLILVALFFISPGEAGVSQTFCIKPNETTECGSVEENQCIDSSCYTLPYYSALQVSCLEGSWNGQLAMSLYKLIAFVLRTLT